MEFYLNIAHKIRETVTRARLIHNKPEDEAEVEAVDDTEVEADVEAEVVADDVAEVEAVVDTVVISQLRSVPWACASAATSRWSATTRHSASDSTSTVMYWNATHCNSAVNMVDCPGPVISWRILVSACAVAAHLWVTSTNSDNALPLDSSQLRVPAVVGHASSTALRMLACGRQFEPNFTAR